ncbi:MAG: IS66 family insertion sequence element accessory protein TnpA [Steroidobacteraceae bacterium]
MSAMRLSPSRRRKDVRAWWAEHLAAQRKSGQTQVAYCRARGLDRKYFTLWKGKLREEPLPAAAQLVPVVVTLWPTPTSPIGSEAATVSPAVCVRLNLANGMSASLEIALEALPVVVRELAALRC